MEKKVYCMINEMCKQIKYKVNEKISDSEMIRRSLIARCATDSLLRSVMNGKSVVLQKLDSDRGNRMCDIEEDEEIADKSDVNVLLITMPQPNVSTLETSNVSPQSSKDSIIINPEILYVESFDRDDIPIENLETGSNEKSSEDSTNKKIIIEEDLENESDAENLHDAGPSGAQQIIVKGNNKCAIPYGSQLPPFTVDLNKIISESGITAKNQHKFIAHWGAYLWNATNGDPTKKDYSHLGSNIITAYPNFGDGMTGGSSLIQKQLSIWIRNHRRTLKPKPKQNLKRDHKGKLKLPSEKAVLVPVELTQKPVTDIKMALEELEKQHTVEKNNESHIKMLLKMTFEKRRPWIENEANRIVDIVTKYPVLGNYDMVLFEFLHMKNATSESIFNAIESMLNKLMEFFKITKKDEYSKMTALTMLYDRLANKRVINKKKHLALFVAKEVMTSAESLIAQKHDAPRAVIFMSEREISNAYIVADEDIQIEIADPSIRKVVAGILAGYYVWHRTYPAGYNNILNYIEFEILRSKVDKKSTTVQKFIRDRDNFFNTRLERGDTV